MSQKADHTERALDPELLRLVAKAARRLLRAKPKQGITRGWGEDAHPFGKHHRAELKPPGLCMHVGWAIRDVSGGYRWLNTVAPAMPVAGLQSGTEIIPHLDGGMH